VSLPLGAHTEVLACLLRLPPPASELASLTLHEKGERLFFFTFRGPAALGSIGLLFLSPLGPRVAVEGYLTMRREARTDVRRRTPTVEVPVVRRLFLP
jgi:hypothetical protein